MMKLEAAEILLVDDSADAELTVRTLRRGKVSNSIFPVSDGV